LASGIVGALVGQYIPTIDGMSFALVALFIVLTMESFSANPDWSLPGLALVCAAVGWVVSEQSLMVIGLGLYLAVLLVRFWSPTVDETLTLRSGRGHSDPTDAEGGTPR
ncbi:MAG: branched-chain amino acid ABC transporter permease, partial [Corynebacterium kroppenstedtii]|nr:branched-chain amino acid ABC transporter permease [Corynebacterium kroppenstedtii]